MSEMCSTCPFRDKDERRELLRFIKPGSSERWPCHESDPHGNCDGSACYGHVQAAEPPAEGQPK